MNIQELEDFVLRNTREISDIHQQLDSLATKEKKVENAMLDLCQRTKKFLDNIDHDNYKSTDQRLIIHSFANKIIIFDKLGYDTGLSGSFFVLAINAFLDGSNQ
jgi:hypothetical protein